LGEERFEELCQFIPLGFGEIGFLVLGKSCEQKDRMAGVVVDVDHAGTTAFASGPPTDPHFANATCALHDLAAFWIACYCGHHSFTLLGGEDCLGILEVAGSLDDAVHAELYSIGTPTDSFH
jgi:hypothetical protein